MTRDEIVRMARQVWDEGTVDLFHNGYWVLTQQELERFAALVAAAEREACARVCESEAEKWEGDDGPISTEARLCALNIRARGT